MSKQNKKKKTDTINVNKKTLWISLGVMAILLIVAFFYFNDSFTGSALATVNGEDITSEDVELIQQSAVLQGQELTQGDALDQAINIEVLLQQAEQEGISFTREEIEEEIESQLSAQGMGMEEYKEELKSQGLSYEEEIDTYKDQFAIQSYIGVQTKDQIPEVSEEEAREFYDAYKQQSPEEVPPFEEIEEQIIMSLQQEAQQEATSSLIQQLRENADIEYHN